MNLTWTAHYSNGLIIHEGAQPYKTLDRNGLREFSLATEHGETKASVNLSKDQKLFYRRRTLDFWAGVEPRVIYLLGWRTKTSKRIIIVTEKGEVFEDTEFRNEWYEPDWTAYPQEQL